MSKPLTETAEGRAELAKVLRAAQQLQSNPAFKEFLLAEPFPSLMAALAAEIELKNPLVALISGDVWVDWMRDAISIAIVCWEDQPLYDGVHAATPAKMEPK